MDDRVTRDGNVIPGVPIIDFSAYNLDDDADTKHNGTNQLIHRVHEALTTIGFFHLKNFGIPAQVVEKAFSVSKDFFTLSEKDKQPYKCGIWIPEGKFHGWVSTDLEGLDLREAKKDFKESFNFMAEIKETPTNEFPDVPKVPELKPALLALFQQCTLLHNKILKVMARGLGLPDPMTLVNLCRRIGKPDNTTTLRTLSYPPIPPGTDTEKLIRCGEHSDYGSITLLFQDDKGGLEVKDISGQWIPITPIPDTVLVNIGDLMQRMTSDKYIAAKHRVVFSANASTDSRQSIAFFGNPDDDALIECLDGSSKYPPVNALEYNHDRARRSRLSYN